jgi:hypothetical protein
MIAFLVLTIMLLIYYVGRLITLYIGAVLAPIVLLLHLLPAFKDFATTALKIYLTTIFVLFVQVVIMQLASSIFSGMLQGNSSDQPNTLMALIVGLATVLALLKTQGVMKELAWASSTPRAAREMAGTFMRGFSYMHKAERSTVKNVKKTSSFVKGKKSKGSSTNYGSPKTGKGGQAPLPGRNIDAQPIKTGETQRMTTLSGQERTPPVKKTSSTTSKSSIETGKNQ